MASSHFLLPLLLLCAAFTKLHALQKGTEYSMRSEIRSMILNEYSGDSPLPSRDYTMAAGLLRMAFHDCVGKRCDGCINMKNEDNAGLDVYINKTEILYQKLKGKSKPPMSRADFWALAAIEAITVASEVGTCPRCKKEYPKVKFQTGRKDCVGKPKGSPWTNDVHKFPNPLGSTKETTKFFKDQFGFSDMDTAAIMGAHTLGQAHPAASGFARPWVRSFGKFDNEYYKVLLKGSGNGDWKNVQLGRRRFGKWQWESLNSNGVRFMMLNADMSLIKNLTKVSSRGEVRGCTFNTCKAVDSKVSNTAYWVKQFAKDNSLFLKRFARAFQKMISHGYTKLNDVQPWPGVG